MSINTKPYSINTMKGGIKLINVLNKVRKTKLYITKVIPLIMAKDLDLNNQLTTKVNSDKNNVTALILSRTISNESTHPMLLY